MKITRRQFIVIWGVVPPTLLSMNGEIVERRVYDRAGAVPPWSVLRRCGIARLARYEDERHVEFRIPFDSLAERTRAWDRFNCDPDWCALRAGSDVRLTEISFS